MRFKYKLTLVVSLLVSGLILAILWYVSRPPSINLRVIKTEEILGDILITWAIQILINTQSTVRFMMSKDFDSINQPCLHELKAFINNYSKSKSNTEVDASRIINILKEKINLKENEIILHNTTEIIVLVYEIMKKMNHVFNKEFFKDKKVENLNNIFGMFQLEDNIKNMISLLEKEPFCDSKIDMSSQKSRLNKELFDLNKKFFEVNEIPNFYNEVQDKSLDEILRIIKKELPNLKDILVMPKNIDLKVKMNEKNSTEIIDSVKHVFMKYSLNIIFCIDSGTSNSSENKKDDLNKELEKDSLGFIKNNVKLYIKNESKWTRLANDKIEKVSKVEFNDCGLIFYKRT